MQYTKATPITAMRLKPNNVDRFPLIPWPLASRSGDVGNQPRRNP